MGRLVALAGVAALLAGGGAAAAMLAPLPGAAAGTTAATSTATTTTTSPAVTTNVSTAPAVLAFTGHGYGHGLGLAQWGAYGYATHGWTAERILGHYYPGTTLGAAPVRTVRVLVAQGRSLTLSSSAPWTAVGGDGVKTALDPRTLTLGPKLTVDGTQLAPPVTFTATSPLSVGGHAYRGKLVVAPDGAVLDAVDVVGLEAYVKGVVPAEMPSNWPAAALEAQAVAARSYALANLSKGRPYDLYGDTRSQAYGGVAAETAGASAAVDATKGRVVLYGGKVADTLFFASSGGRTASALESTGVAVPYLIPVVDPYDTLSPYHDWGPVLIDAAAAAKALKLTGQIGSVSAVDGPSGRVRSMVVTSTDDLSVSLTGNQVRSALGLRSTWFAPAFLQLGPAARTMTYGGAVTISGSAAGADALSLEARPAGLDWQPAGDLVLDADGRFATIVKPQVSTAYRLAWGDARAGLARVTVAARVSAVVVPDGVEGTLRPLAPGAPVQLQQRGDAGGWTTVATGAADSTSAWRFTTSLAAGTYRVRAVPGHGVAAGASAAFTVQ